MCKLDTMKQFSCAMRQTQQNTITPSPFVLLFNNKSTNSTINKIIPATINNFLRVYPPLPYLHTLEI